MANIRYYVAGVGSIAGVIAMVLGWPAAKRLRNLGAAVIARKANRGAWLGAVGLGVYVISLISIAGAHTDTIYNASSVSIPVGQAKGMGFQVLTGGSEDVHYTVVGAPSDSFTVCIVSDAQFEAWAGATTPSMASGVGCHSLVNSASDSVKMTKGSYDLAIDCWNQLLPCSVTVTLSATG